MSQQLRQLAATVRHSDAIHLEADALYKSTNHLADFGIEASFLGDINGDGRNELAIGSPGFNWYLAASSEPRADIYLGSTATFTF